MDAAKGRQAIAMGGPGRPCVRLVDAPKCRPLEEHHLLEFLRLFLNPDACPMVGPVHDDIETRLFPVHEWLSNSEVDMMDEIGITDCPFPMLHEDETLVKRF